MTAVPHPTSFERLKVRYRLTAELVAETGLRIGAGKSLDAAATDQPVMRDALGNPFLPGSSLKGVLRSGLESVIRGLGREDLWACDPFAALDDRSEPESYDENRDVIVRSCGRVTALRRGGDGRLDPARELSWVLENTCTVCGLFGSPSLAGRVFVHDLPQLAGARPEVRDGVGLDRDLGTASAGIKYDVEVIPVGSRFRLEMVFENVDHTQLALVLQALRMLDQGQLLVGGMTSRGLGRARLEKRVLEKATPANLLEGRGFETLDFEAQLAQAGEQLSRILDSTPTREEE